MTSSSYRCDESDKLLDVRTGAAYPLGTVVKSFSYDGAGRTTGVTTSAGTTSLTWTHDDRVASITYPSTSTNTFAYNGFGTRTSKTDSSGTRNYLRSGAGVTSPVVNDGAASYTPGISERRSGTTTYSSSDIKNTTTQLQSQTISATKQYDAFGNVTNSTGTFNGPFGYGGDFGYQSDADSGLMLLGHRYYDSSTGRFLSRDWATWGRNWYSYCAGNPITFADPRGLRPVPSVQPVDNEPPGPWEDQDNRDGWQKFLDGAFDFSVGWGDGASFGLTGIVREGISPGSSNTIDQNSWGYRVGNAGGFINGSVIAVGGTVRAWGASRRYLAGTRFETNTFRIKGITGNWGIVRRPHIHWRGSSQHWPWDTRGWSAIELAIRKALHWLRRRLPWGMVPLVDEEQPAIAEVS